eukprot:10003219-Karenia_brevis.AAC.1
MMSRRHLVQPAGGMMGPGGLSMSAAVAVSDGAAPYYVPGIAMPFDGLVARQAPQGLETRGFKRAVEFSEAE